MSKSFLERFVQSQTNMRRFQQERAILEATGEICLALEDQSLSRADLAKRLGKTQGWVTQLLDGKKNKTIRTIADVLAVLGREMHVSTRPISIGVRGVSHESSELAVLKVYASDKQYRHKGESASLSDTVELRAVN